MLKNYFRTILIVVLLMTCSLGFAEKMVHKILPNGMEVVTKENTSNNSVSLYCFVKTGSIHEGEFLNQGISHYLEHIVSGGSTSSHTEAEYKQMREEIGAMANAYTIYTATVYHIMSDAQYVDQSLDILSQNISDCAFDADEITREKEVIVKEFVLRVSPPDKKMRHRMRERTFPGSNYTYEVIGNLDLYKDLEREDLIKYYDQRYKPNNMVFVAAGNFDADEMMTKIENAFADFERGIVIPPELPPVQVRPGDVRFVEEFDIEAPNGYMTWVLDREDHDDFMALNMAVSILFHKSSSHMQKRLNEDLNLVNYVYGYVNDGGYVPEPFVQIGFAPVDIAMMDNIVEQVEKELEAVLETGITQDQIDEVINRMKASKVINSPSAEDDCERIGWNILKYNVPEVYDMQLAEFQEMTPTDIERVIKEYLVDGNKVVFFGLPKGQKQVLDIVNEEFVVDDMIEFQMAKNTSLVHKRNTRKPVIDGTLTIPLTQQYEDATTATTLDFMVTMMMKGGSKEFSNTELSDWLEDHYATMYGTVYPHGTVFYFTCLKDDFPTLKKMLKSAFNDPEFAQAEIDKYKKSLNQSYLNGKTDPQKLHLDYRRGIMYKGKRDGVSLEDRNNIVQELTREDLIKIHKKYFKATEAKVVLFGDLDSDEAKDYAQELRTFLPSGAPEGTEYPLEIPEMDEIFVNEYEHQQVNVNINYKAPAFGTDDYYAMKVIEIILSSGQKSRLHHATREINDLAYFASASYYVSSEYAFFMVTSQTSKDKRQELLDVIQNEVVKLQEGKVTQEEINKAVAGWEMMMKAYITDDNMINFVTHNYASGFGYDHLVTLPEHLLKVSPEDVKRAANTWLDKGGVFVSEPGKDVKSEYDS